LVVSWNAQDAGNLAQVRTVQPTRS
jgi:hypothetical protein